MANLFRRACAASIVRVVAFDLIDVNDITYTIVPVSMWNSMEQSIGIICACLPTTRPLFGRLLHNFRHASGRNEKPHIAGYATSIPLAHYSSRRAADGPTGRARDGFSPLSEENLTGFSSVTAHASQSASGHLPVVPERIVRQQTLVQHVEILA